VNDKPSWAKFESLFEGLGETPRSLVSESAEPSLTAIEKAERRWRHAELMNGDRSEQHEA
jgi:hypothetical protein